MSKTMGTKSLSVLISGASIAGPALAHWLERYGFDVTVVERAPAVRSGGYPIDIRGTAIDVVDRMGVLPQLRVAHIDTRRLRFFEPDKTLIATIIPESLVGGMIGHDVELPRGALTSVLYELTRHQAVRYRFNDSIESLNDDGTGVDVRFKSGATQRFDIVVGADGMHSNTRAMVFGPEEPFSRYLGFYFNLFSMPNTAGLSHEAVIYAEPGRAGGIYAVGDSPTVTAFLNFASPEPPPRVGVDGDAQRRRTVEIFASSGPILRDLLAAMQRADDVFSDTVSQIHMPKWSSGRVVLVGDAAHAPSFLSGQGSSLALVGAYLLAGELAAHRDVTEAFLSYEHIARPFVEANQALALRKGVSLLMPRTQEELDARNAALKAMERAGGRSERADQSRRVHNALTLPDYSRLVSK